MWLALLLLPLRRGREMPSEGPLQGYREGFLCSAPPFSFLLINSPASLISPDEMRPREHCPPRSAVWRFNYPPSGKKEGLTEGWAVAELHQYTQTHRSTQVGGWLSSGRARHDPAKRTTLDCNKKSSGLSGFCSGVTVGSFLLFLRLRKMLFCTKLHQPISFI